MSPIGEGSRRLVFQVLCPPLLNSFRAEFRLLPPEKLLTKAAFHFDYF